MTARHSCRPNHDSRELGLEPIIAFAEIDDQRDRERRGVLHLVFDESHELIALGARDLEYELVVNLEEHAAAHLAGAQRGIDSDHRDLDEIRG